MRSRRAGWPLHIFWPSANLKLGGCACDIVDGLEEGGEGLGGQQLAAGPQQACIARGHNNRINSWRAHALLLCTRALAQAPPAPSSLARPLLLPAPSLAQAAEIAGQPFNLSSSLQLSEVLYTQLGLPPPAAAGR